MGIVNEDTAIRTTAKNKADHAFIKWADALLTDVGYRERDVWLAAWAARGLCPKTLPKKFLPKK